MSCTFPPCPPHIPPPTCLLLSTSLIHFSHSGHLSSLQISLKPLYSLFPLPGLLIFWIAGLAHLVAAFLNCCLLSEASLTIISTISALSSSPSPGFNFLYNTCHFPLYYLSLSSLEFKLLEGQEFCFLHSYALVLKTVSDI